MKRRQFIQAILGLAAAAPVASCARLAPCDVTPAPARPEMRLRNGSTIAFDEAAGESYLGHAEYPWRSMRDGFVVDEGDIHTATYKYWRGWDPCREVFHDGVGNEVSKQDVHDRILERMREAWEQCVREPQPNIVAHGPLSYQGVPIVWDDELLPDSITTEPGNRRVFYFDRCFNRGV